MTKPGDELRDLAAEYLALTYGNAKKEARVSGKKVDVYVEDNDFGRTRRLYIEAKDYTNPLTRSQIAHIYADYSGIVRHNSPASLIIITRNGVTTDGDAYVGEQPDIRHLTIRDLEILSIGLSPYVKFLAEEYQAAAPGSSYIHPDFYRETSPDTVLEFNEKSRINATEEIYSWINNTGDNKPIAILGGYGVGKTSLSDYIATEQAKLHLNNPEARIPILIKLGNYVYSSRLSGVLSELFQSQHKIETYSYQRFRNFHERGRFLIILDGFDEMKHAMSWNDFSYIVGELAKMNNERSKILLLGRPSAFTSDSEARYVLRGQKRSHKSFIKMPNWPNFSTYQIAPFSIEQRDEFIREYISSNMRKISQDINIDSRIDHVISISNKNASIFSRPVHLKMLSDLSVSESFSNQALEKIDTHWSLYEFFLLELLEREVQKDARRQISQNDRKEFLKRLAMWLWRERDAQTHFAIDEFPESIVPSVFEEIDDTDAKRRELLTIPLIERKSGNYCYFVHRSFAEFLVALSFAEESDARTKLQVYQRLLTDGIIGFLTEVIDINSIIPIIDELKTFRGYIAPEFLTLVFSKTDPSLVATQLQNSPWIWAYVIVVSERSGASINQRFEEAISKASNAGLALFGDAVMQSSFGVRFDRTDASYQAIGASLLARFFKNVKWSGSARSASAVLSSQEAAWNKRLVVACFTDPRSPSNTSPYVDFFPSRLARFLSREAQDYGAYTTTADLEPSSQSDSDFFVSVSMEMIESALDGGSEHLKEFFKREKRFKGITEIDSKNQRR